MVLQKILTYALSISTGVLFILLMVSYSNIKSLETKVNDKDREIKQLTYNFTQIKLSLDHQNQLIQQKELELEAYKNKKPEIQKEIVTKYEKAIIDDKGCQQELKSFKDLLDIFNKRSN